MKLSYRNVSDSILEIKPDKRHECFNFGIDNAYPSLIETLIEMSVTAKSCHDKASKAVYGKGFGELGNIIVNSDNETLNEVLRKAARDYKKHNNCFIHIGYNGNLNIKSISILPVTDVRIGKADDLGYSGKFLIYNNWDKKVEKKIKPEKFKIVDRYNPSKEVIESQIAKSGDITKYNGQILHVRKDSKYIYSLSDLHPVLGEALLEANSQTFRTVGSENGFLNNKMITVNPFADETERKDFVKSVNDIRGAKGNGKILVCETSQTTDDVSKQTKIDDLSGTYNDKLFDYSDKQAEKNICKAFAVPLILVSQNDNSVFGNSGALLKEAKLQLWEENEEERNQLQSVFNNLMNNFETKSEKVNGSFKIINPYIDNTQII